MMHGVKILIDGMSPFGYTAIFKLRRLSHPSSEVQETDVPLTVLRKANHFFRICVLFPATVWNPACYHDGRRERSLRFESSAQEGLNGRNSMKFYLFIICLGIPLISHARTQAAAETAAAVAGTSPSKVKSAPLPATLAEDHPNSSTHVTNGSGPTTASLNRQILERQAGPEAGKLLLRSEPSGARAWIDGLFIGKTPILVLLAPGQHRMEIYGPRQKFASRVLKLLPRETRDVAMELTVRYPTHVIVR